MRNLLARLILSTTLTLGFITPALAQDGPPAKAPARPSRTARAGPAPTRIKGLRHALPITDQEWVQATLRDFRGGMIVVVEDKAPLPWEPALTGHHRMFGPWSPSPFDLSLVPGMDPSKVISGGNTISQSYPLGWSN